MADERRLGPAELRAVRIGSLVFLTARGGQLLFSTAMVVNDWRKYRRPVLQAGLLAGCWVQSAWLARRMLRRGGYDDRAGVWVDATAASAVLIASRPGLGEGAAAAWAKNIAIGAVIGASGSPRSAEGALAAAGVSAAGVAFGLGATGRDSRVAGRALAANDAISWLGMHAASRVYLRAHRRYARLRDEADALAVERAGAAAAAIERARHQEVLHRVTVEVLRQIAASDDLAAATAIAQVEATRLRYALRSGGRLPAGLDAALAEVAADPTTGVRVELVTAELTDEVAPEVVAALRDAVFSVLSAAHDVAGATRAVVHASSDGAQVTVTVREHGAGFAPGTGSVFEQRLEASRAAVSGSGAEMRWWSEPGEGVRLVISSPLARRAPVTSSPLAVRASAGAGDGDDAPHRVPNGRIGWSAAGDDAHAVGDGDVEVGLTAARFDTAQDEVGGFVLDDGHVGGAGDALQAGAQQRPLGGDAGRRGFGHRIRVTEVWLARVVRTTHIEHLPEQVAADADRTLLAGVLSWRATGLATGVATLVAGRRQVRHAGVAVLQVAVAAAESAWLARQALQPTTHRSRTPAVVDAVTAVGLLATSYLNLDPRDRPTWLNWVPWSFAANALTLQGMQIPRSAGPLPPVAILAGEALQGPTAGDVAANVIAMTGFYAGARSFAGLIRTEAVRLEQARDEAIVQGRLLAVEQERARALRLLHDNALQSLEAIAAGRYRDLAALRARLRDEADLLESGFQMAAWGDEPPLVRLQSVLVAHRERGLRIAAAGLDAAALEGIAPSRLEALCGACHELLTNVAKHARTDDVSVALVRETEMITLQVADRGVGFDPAVAGRGFGMRQSVRQRIADVGGTVDVHSTVGHGTRVVLRVPS